MKWLHYFAGFYNSCQIYLFTDCVILSLLVGCFVGALLRLVDLGLLDDLVRPVGGGCSVIRPTNLDELRLLLRRRLKSDHWAVAFWSQKSSIRWLISVWGVETLLLLSDILQRIAKRLRSLVGHGLLGNVQLLLISRWALHIWIRQKFDYSSITRRGESSSCL